jgi:hypothetical protein
MWRVDGARFARLAGSDVQTGREGGRSLGAEGLPGNSCGLARGVVRAPGGGRGDHLAAEWLGPEGIDVPAECEQRGPGVLRLLEGQQKPVAERPGAILVTKTLSPDRLTATAAGAAACEPGPP